MPIALCAILALAALAVAATWPGFEPKAILVSGNQRVSRGEILARAHVAPLVSIWLQNTNAIGKRIAAIPYVDIAHVRRIPPSTIRIVVTERKPFAVLRSGGQTALVDSALRILEAAQPGMPYPELVLPVGMAFEPGEFVRNPTALSLRNAYESIEGSDIVATALQYDRFGGLVVTVRGGLRLLLGSDRNLSQKVALADAILAQVVGRRRPVAAIDLRAPSAPVLVYR